MLRAIARLVAVMVTIYVIWHEFPELAIDAQFMMLLLTWAMYAVILFLFEYSEAKKKPMDEKIAEKLDELINEIRQDRNERNSK